MNDRENQPQTARGVFGQVAGQIIFFGIAWTVLGQVHGNTLSTATGACIGAVVGMTNVAHAYYRRPSVL